MLQIREMLIKDQIASKLIIWELAIISKLYPFKKNPK